MSRPTREEIDAEIEALEALKPRIPARTFFGDDNHAAIDAQIAVLRGEVDEDETFDNEESGEWSEHTGTSARDACSWMDGDSETSPSEDWATIAK